MEENEIIRWIDRQGWISSIGAVLQEGVRTVMPATPETEGVEDVLHGTWLGHPLHPVLTDVPIGAWTSAVLLDALDPSGKEIGRAADTAIAFGLVAALATAVTGLADWKYTKGHTRTIGTAHALLNIKATSLFGLSLLLRKRGNRRAGQALSTLGYAVVNAGAYLGGHLVYNDMVGVDHAATEKLPEEWTPVMAAENLAEDRLTRAEANGAPILLVRQNGEIHALAEVCAHMGGPLAEGTLEDGCVSCPWHGSTYALTDGHVVHGPSAYPEPALDGRLRDGQVEVRRRRA